MNKIEDGIVQTTTDLRRVDANVDSLNTNIRSLSSDVTTATSTAGDA